MLCNSHSAAWTHGEDRLLNLDSIYVVVDRKVGILSGVNISLSVVCDILITGGLCFYLRDGRSSGLSRYVYRFCHPLLFNLSPITQDATSDRPFDALRSPAWDPNCVCARSYTCGCETKLMVLQWHSVCQTLHMILVRFSPLISLAIANKHQISVDPCIPHPLLLAHTCIYRGKA